MNIAVIGAGASGLTAAIAAARNGASVTIYERNDKAGKKILVTGNGKCNIGNMSLSEDYYYSEDRDFIVSALDRFGLDETISFFKGLGLLLNEKRGGLYPYSEQASTVQDALRYEALSLGVKFVVDSFVNAVNVNKDGSYKVTYEHKVYDTKNKDKKGRMPLLRTDVISSVHDRIIISTGGKAAPNTGSDGNGYKLVQSLGHSVTEIYPALIGLRCEGDFWKSISGVRCNANITITADGAVISSEGGELQITDYGISGIPVFQISRTASKAIGSGKKVYATIDFMPELSREMLKDEMIIRFLLISDRTNEQFYNGFFNKKITMLLLKLSGMDPNKTVSSDDFDKLIDRAKNFKVKVIADNGFEQAQVSAGGVRLIEISDCFESKISKGLYITGELLDVDGNVAATTFSGHGQAVI